MAYRRRGPDLTSALTFGGRVPATVGFLLVAMLVASVLAWQSPGFEALAAFIPGALLAGQLWRLVSWAFVEGNPLNLLFAGMMLWWLGPQLIHAWGERRFAIRAIGITAGATIATTLLAVVWPPANQPHVGAWPVIDALIVAWAMLYPDRQVNIYGILPVTGKMLALLTVGGTVLYSLAGRGGGGFGAFMLHFTAMGIGFALSRGFSPGRMLRDAQRRMQERETRRRAKHLRVLRRDGKDDRSGWMN
jgi:membrane associated rhomboid family serine protease